MGEDKCWERGGYLLRPVRSEDAEAYYTQCFDPLDPEVVRFTGCKPVFSREEVVSAFLRYTGDANRRFYLLLDRRGQIVGESVINEIDWEMRKANYRVAIFSPSARGKGLGTWMAEKACETAFGELGLHRLELDVYSFNPRAERAYEKAGFRREGVLRDGIRDGEGYADDILMAILEEEWRGAHPRWAPLHGLKFRKN